MAEWTAAQVKELKRAWKARDVVSVIAECLGMSKNAVVGKAPASGRAPVAHNSQQVAPQAKVEKQAQAPDAPSVRVRAP